MVRCLFLRDKLQDSLGTSGGGPRNFLARFCNLSKGGLGRKRFPYGHVSAIQNSNCMHLRSQTYRLHRRRVYGDTRGTALGSVLTQLHCLPHAQPLTYCHNTLTNHLPTRSRESADESQKLFVLEKATPRVVASSVAPNGQRQNCFSMRAKSSKM